MGRENHLKPQEIWDGGGLIGREEFPGRFERSGGNDIHLLGLKGLRQRRIMEFCKDMLKFLVG
jgi:hypothetical protein